MRMPRPSVNVAPKTNSDCKLTVASLFIVVAGFSKVMSNCKTKFSVARAAYNSVYAAKIPPIESILL